MRLVVQAARCLVIFVAAVIGILGIIAVLDPLESGESRVIGGAVAVMALGLGWFIWDRSLRDAAARTAQHSEKPGSRPGTRMRSYRGYAFEVAVEWFQRDARLLAPKGYRVTDTSWESLEQAHPVRYLAVRLLGLLTRGANWGEDGGTLTATYELGSTPDEALAALDSYSRRLRDGPIDDRSELDDAE
jgi:hypothetical protein